MKVVGIVHRFDFVNKSIVLGLELGKKDERFYAAGSTIDGMLRDTDLENLTEFEVEVDGRVITSYRKLRDMTREELWKELTLKAAIGGAA